MKISGVEFLLFVNIGMLFFIGYEVLRLRMVQEGKSHPSLLSVLGTGTCLASIVVGLVIAIKVF